MAGDAGPGCGSWDEPAALYFSVTLLQQMSSLRCLKSVIDFYNVSRHKDKNKDLQHHRALDLNAETHTEEKTCVYLDSTGASTWRLKSSAWLSV